MKNPFVIGDWKRKYYDDDAISWTKEYAEAFGFNIFPREDE